MNKQESARLVAVILASYPQQAAKLDQSRQLGMIDAFESLLDDLTYAQCNAALRVLLQTRTWMPSVAEIRATVVELERGPQRNGGDAWGSVLDAIRRYGAYRTPGVDFQFADPLVARCVQALGWQNLCLSEMQTSDRKQFVELYEKLAAQSQRQAQAPALAEGRQPYEPMQIESVASSAQKLIAHLSLTKKAAP